MSEPRITWSVANMLTVGVGRARMGWLELVLCALSWLRVGVALGSMAAFAI